MYGRQVYAAIHGDLSVVEKCNGKGHKGLGKTSRSICRIFWRSKRSSAVKGLSGRSIYENLELYFAKPFNSNRREIRFPEYRRGIKDPNTTQWRRGAVSHTTNVSKSFSVTRLNFGQGVGKGATYRQSALIPTCDTLDSIVH